MTFIGGSIILQGLDAYKKTRRLAAPPDEELSALFTELTETVVMAKAAISEGRLEAAHQRLVLAQTVLAGLRTGLAPEPAEVVENLKTLYQHVELLLARANMEKKTDDIDSALEILKILRETWAEAASVLP